MIRETLTKKRRLDIIDIGKLEQRDKERAEDVKKWRKMRGGILAFVGGVPCKPGPGLRKPRLFYKRPSKKPVTLAGPKLDLTDSSR